MSLLDHLRLVAAGSVLCFHYFFIGIRNGRLGSVHHLSGFSTVARYGNLGVDLFFVISGFVVYDSVVGKTGRAFAVGRVVRLFPAYWAAVLLTSAVTVVWGSRAGLSVTPTEVLANLTMAPQVLRAPFVDGVYWTLLLEGEFYVVVYVVVSLGAMGRFSRLLPAWALTILALQAGPGRRLTFPLVGGYFALFAAGALLACARREGWTAWRVLGLTAAACGSVLASDRQETDLASSTRVQLSPVVAGVVVGLSLLLVASMLVPRLAHLRLPGAAAAGAVTYPLYLVHDHIGYIVLSRFATGSNQGLVYALVITGVVALAWSLHVVVEVWMSRFWTVVLGATAGRLADLLPRWVRRGGRADEFVGGGVRRGT